MLPPSAKLEGFLYGISVGFLIVAVVSFVFGRKFRQMGAQSAELGADYNRLAALYAALNTTLLRRDYPLPPVDRPPPPTQDTKH